MAQPQNDYLPIAAAPNANALTPAQWKALGTLLAAGFQAGVVPSIQFNTFLRQLSVPVSAIAQFMADNQSADILDDGVVANFEAKLKAAIQNTSAYVDQAGQAVFFTAGGSSTAFVGTLAPAPTSLTPDMEVLGFFGTGNTNTSPTLNLNGLGAKPILKSNGQSPAIANATTGAPADIQGFVPLILNAAGSAWIVNGPLFSDLTTAAGTVARPKLTTATTYYVDPVNGSDSNTGLSPATPWKTRQKAWNTIVNTIDLAGNNVTVRLLPGTYTDSFLASCPVIGNSNGVGAVLFQGTVGNNAAVLIATTNSNGWLNQGGAQFLLDSMSIQTAGTNTIGIAAGSGGIIAYSNIAFGQCTLAHISASAGGRTQQIGPVTINSGAVSHVAAADGGGAIIAGQTFTLVGTPAFTQFASVEGSAQVTANSLTITGGATGKQYTIIGSGTLKTTGQTLPGNAAGTSPTTSQVI